MGLIRAAAGAVGGVLADQWKEFFYCDALDKEVLVKKGEKRISGRSSNTKGSDNIISNGSGIAVADGQCMIIVEQGKIVEVCAEPGEFTYDSSTEPSLFTGKLGQSIKETFKTVGKRFTYGGDTGKDQRVYYFNTKELIDNKFGTATPIQFKVFDQDTNFKLTIGLRCNGVYSYKIADPLVFYTRVCANVTNEYNRGELDPQLKSEFIAALQPAFARISAKGIDYTEIPGYTLDLADEMNSVLSEKWGDLRGLEIVSIAINSITASPEDEAKIQRMQEAKAMSNPLMAAGRMVNAQASAMEDAANNPNGAMNGFFGMGFAQQQGGMNAQNLFQMGMQQQQQQAGQPAPAEPAAQGAAPGSWKCSCGASATGKFCPECGSPKPADDGWKCPECGTVNKGKFCSNCGAKKPAGEPVYRCDKCGWEPEDPKNPPKFCPECGDKFDEGDIQ